MTKPVFDYNLYKNFINQAQTYEHKQTDDILSKYPTKLCGYSNELGAAISPINGTLGNILWAPSLMYLGADIYDKYKNEDKTYNPDKRRGLKRAIYQGISSLVLTTGVIKMGQKIGVHIAKGKDSLSPAEKKELVEFSMNFLENSDYPKEDNKDFTDSLINAFKQKTKINKKRLQKKNVFNKLASFFSEPKCPEHTMSRYLKEQNENNPVIEYLKAQGKIATDILSDENAIQAEKYRKYFKRANSKFENIEIARKETVLKIFKDKNINKSLAATASGFIALAIFMKPMDMLADYIIMPKIIEPLIDKIPNKNTTKDANK